MCAKMFFTWLMKGNFRVLLTVDCYTDEILNIIWHIVLLLMMTETKLFECISFICWLTCSHSSERYSCLNLVCHILLLFCFVFVKIKLVFSGFMIILLFNYRILKCRYLNLCSRKEYIGEINLKLSCR